MSEYEIRSDYIKVSKDTSWCQTARYFSEDKDKGCGVSVVKTRTLNPKEVILKDKMRDGRVIGCTAVKNNYGDVLREEINEGSLVKTAQLLQAQNKYAATPRQATSTIREVFLGWTFMEMLKLPPNACKHVGSPAQAVQSKPVKLIIAEGTGEIRQGSSVSILIHAPEEEMYNNPTMFKKQNVSVKPACPGDISVTHTRLISQGRNISRMNVLEGNDIYVGLKVEPTARVGEHYLVVTTGEKGKEVSYPVMIKVEEGERIVPDICTKTGGTPNKNKKPPCDCPPAKPTWSIINGCVKIRKQPEPCKDVPPAKKEACRKECGTTLEKEGTTARAEQNECVEPYKYGRK